MNKVLHKKNTKSFIRLGRVTSTTFRCHDLIIRNIDDEILDDEIITLAYRHRDPKFLFN